MEKPRFWRLLWLLPFPWFIAWFRWRWERECALEVIQRSGLGQRDVVIARWVDALWRRQKVWPKAWMMAWLTRHGGVGATAIKHRLTGVQILRLTVWDAREVPKGWKLQRHHRGITLERAPWGWSVLTDRGYDRPMEPPTDDVMKAMRHSDLTSAIGRALWLEGSRPTE